MVMDQFMQKAVEEARTAQKKGCAAFGAVLVRDGKIISAAHNLTDLNGDPTSHSELEVIRALGSKEDLSDTVMYGSAFPCLMCAGAIVFFKIPKVVVGTSWPGYEPSLALLESQGVEVELLELEECFNLIESML
jgi:creatinine deaminase